MLDPLALAHLRRMRSASAEVRRLLTPGGAVTVAWAVVEPLLEDDEDL